MKKLAWLLFALVFWSKNAFAQLSPGELTRAHAGLEGMFNCTKCHEIGEKVADRKCLECHLEIKTRIDEKRGFHASDDARGKGCAECHSDHHGRNFDLVRWDKKAFDHSKTGWALDGKHQKIDCRDCHKPDFVEDAGLKKREKTFLGLWQNCASCHADPHEKTLGSDCAKCHATDAFAPAPRFDHAKTAFALAGKHKSVSCAECHPKTARADGGFFQKFDGVAHASCANCHDDPHRAAVGKDCKTCHSVEGFEVFRGAAGRFDHSKTHFPLVGKHRSVDCAGCHELKNADAATVFLDRKGVKPTACATCHDDPHEGRFGLECKACHTEESFKIAGIPPNFDHAKTDFPLAGRHAAVNCRDCHKADFVEPLAHNACAACHSDAHDGQLFREKSGPDCAACHSVDGFAPADFSVERHAATRFVLDGAHVATPCFACHLPEKAGKKAEKWQFRGLGERCADCHRDPHEAFLDQKFYPQKSCENCHATADWAASKFDHSKTSWPLAGAHARVSCGACHRKGEAEPLEIRFAGLEKSCAGCHADEHAGQFEKDGATDCRRCHQSSDEWRIKRFDHQKTRFPLDGKHAQVACRKCHEPTEINGKTTARYKYDAFECAVCHK